MHKIIGVVSGIVLAFYAKAISTEGYSKYVKQFNLCPSTDIIRGKVLLGSKILESWRFHGDIKFAKKFEKTESQDPKYNKILRESGQACSIFDTSENAMTNLLIQLFPSAGISLNAQGRGALEELSKLDLVNIIVDMFKIAEEVRKNKRTSKIFTLLEEVEKEIAENKKKDDELQAKAQLRKANKGNAINALRGDNVDEAEGEPKNEIAKNIKKNAEQGKIAQNSKNVETKKEAFQSATVKRVGGHLISKKTIFFNNYFGGVSYSGKPATRLINLAKSIANAVLLEEDGTQISEESGTRRLYPPLFVNDLICAYTWDVLSDERLEQLVTELAKNFEYTPSTKNNSHLAEQVIKDELSITSFVPFRPGEHIISNSIANYNGREFSDCAETALRHFFSMLFSRYERDENGERLLLDLSRIPANSALRGFFASFCKNLNIRAVANDGTREVRNAWAKVVSGLTIDTTTYCKNGYELNAGWDNSIKVICALMTGYSAGLAPENKKSLEYHIWLRKSAAENRIKSVNQAVKDGIFDISAEETLVIINDLLGIRTDVTLIAEKRDRLKKSIDCVDGNITIYPKDHREGNELVFCHFGLLHVSVGSIPRVISRDVKREAPSSWIEELYNDVNLAIRGPEETGYGGFRNVKYPMLDYYLQLRASRISTRIERLKDKEYIESIARIFYSGVDTFDLLGFIEFAQKKEAKIDEENIIELCNFIAHRAEFPFYASIAVDFLQKKDPAKIEDLKDLSVLKNSSMTDFMIQICNFGNYYKIKPVLMEKLKKLNDKTLEEVGNLFACIGKFFEKYPQKIRLFDVDILDSLLPYIKSLTKSLKASERPQSFYKSVNNIVSILDLINFNKAPKALPEFIKLVRKKLSSPVFDLKLSFYRNDEKLKVLLPVCYITGDQLAKQTLLEYTGDLTPEIASAFIESIPESDMKNFIERLVLKSDSSVALIKELFWGREKYFHKNNASRSRDWVSKLFEVITNKYGKFSTADAREIMIFFKNSAFVLPFIKPGKRLPHEEAIRFFDSGSVEAQCKAMEYIYAHKIALSPVDEEILIQKILSSNEVNFNTNGLIFSQILDSLSTRPQFPIEIAGLILKCSGNNTAFQKKLFDSISSNGILATDAIDTFLKHIEVTQLIKIIWRSKYKIYTSSAIKLICGIKLDDDEIVNVSKFYGFYIKKISPLLADEKFTVDDIKALYKFLRDDQKEPIKANIDLIKEHCVNAASLYLEEKFEILPPK